MIIFDSKNTSILSLDNAIDIIGVDDIITENDCIASKARKRKQRRMAKSNRNTPTIPYRRDRMCINPYANRNNRHARTVECHDFVRTPFTKEEIYGEEITVTNYVEEPDYDLIEQEIKDFSSILVTNCLECNEGDAEAALQSVIETIVSMYGENTAMKLVIFANS